MAFSARPSLGLQWVANGCGSSHIHRLGEIPVLPGNIECHRFCSRSREDTFEAREEGFVRQRVGPQSKHTARLQVTSEVTQTSIPIETRIVRMEKCIG